MWDDRRRLLTASRSGMPSEASARCTAGRDEAMEPFLEIEQWSGRLKS